MNWNEIARAIARAVRMAFNEQVEKSVLRNLSGIAM